MASHAPAAPVAGGPLAAYAGFNFALAMMALPLFVLVPRFYADATGLALSTIGAVLLATRLVDAFADPLIGAWVDASRRRTGAYLRPVLFALVPLTVGFLLLFLPPALGASGHTLWLAATLVVAMLGYSLASIAYQAWGAELAHDDGGRARVTAAREAVGLAGGIAASALPYALGVPALLVAFVLALVVGSVLLARRAPRPLLAPLQGPPLALRAALAQAWGSRRFRWLLAVFLVNGIAAAVPATLVLFFIADRLQLEAQSGLFLAAYFLAAAASLPLWARLARRTALEPLWLAGMVAAVAAFVWAYWLDSGALVAFLAICMLSGAALGADLALPPALLARVLADDGRAGEADGAYFGLWTFANKLNLALAAGLALPLLEWLGYTPGARSEPALDALSATYALLPCLLKLAAATVLFTAWRQRRF